MFVPNIKIFEFLFHGTLKDHFEKITVELKKKQVNIEKSVL